MTYKTRVVKWLQINSVCCWDSFSTVRARLPRVLYSCGTLFTGSGMSTRKKDTINLLVITDLTYSCVSCCVFTVIFANTNFGINIVLHVLGLFILQWNHILHLNSSLCMQMWSCLSVHYICSWILYSPTHLDKQMHELGKNLIIKFYSATH